MKKELINQIRTFEKTYGMYGGQKKLDGIAITLINGDNIIVGFDTYNYYACKYLGDKSVEKWRFNKGLILANKLYDELIKKVPIKEIRI